MWPVRPKCRFQVDHYAAALHAGLRHVLHAEMARALRLVAWRHVAVSVVVNGADDVATGTVAIVEHIFGTAVAIGIEHLADMRETVPLRRILQRQDHLVIAHDVGCGGIVAAQRIVHVGPVPAHCRLQHRRVAARRENGASGIVQRQRQTERLSHFHLGDALEDFLRGEQVQPAAFIIGAVIAPGRAGRAIGPTRIVCHCRRPSCLVTGNVRRTRIPVEGCPTVRRRLSVIGASDRGLILITPPTACS